ncbi:MAG: carbohydrate ABC transporter permease [Anaerolineae bacterium]|nr:carbohydrate ABC transporter permease [Anaerolineae bacterium]
MADLTTPLKSSRHYIARDILVKAALYLILVIGAVIAIIPFLWMIQTSFKTYGEHSTRTWWPAGLSLTPYQGRPATQEIVIPMQSAEGWRNIPRSFNPALEGKITINQVSRYVADRLAEKDFSIPFDVLILATDTTDDGIVNYDSYRLTVDSRIVEQFTTRIDGNEMGGPNFNALSVRGRWGPHIQVSNPDPENFTVKVTWSIWRMLFNNFIYAWKDANFAVFMFNSFKITAITIVGVVVTSTLAAYAFARMDFPLKNLIFTGYLATYMIPGAVVLIPNYLIIVGLETFFTETLGIANAWYDNWTALTIPFMINAFSVFLLRQFFAQIPDELYDASLIDGCGHLRFLSQVVVPLSKAPIMSIVIFNGIWAWNQLQWPLIVTSTERWRPVTVGLTSFISEASAETQLIMAGSVITTIPILVLYFFTQKTFTEGIATTGLKG